MGIAYRKKFGQNWYRSGYKGTWETHEELIEQIKEALRTGVPIKLVELPPPPPENPYAMWKKNLDKESDTHKALYAYGEKFKRAFPLGPGDHYTDEHLLAAIDKALKTGVPVEPRHLKYPKGAIPKARKE